MNSKPLRAQKAVKWFAIQTTSRPEGREIESRKSGVRTFLAEAGKIGIDQTRIPLRDIVIFELQFLARGMRCVNDEHVGPLGQPLENLLRARSFQIEGNATLVSIRQLEGIRLFRMRLGRDLLPLSPQLSLRRLDLDDFRAEVGQDCRSAGAGNETCEVHDFQS